MAEMGEGECGEPGKGYWSVVWGEGLNARGGGRVKGSGGIGVRSVSGGLMAGVKVKWG